MPRLHASTSSAVRAVVNSSVVVMATFSARDFDVLEDAESVRNEDGRGVVEADEVRQDGLVVDTHEPHRETWLDLVRDAGLVQSDDALVVLARTHPEDRAGPALADRNLVAGDDRHAAPGGH